MFYIKIRHFRLNGLATRFVPCKYSTISDILLFRLMIGSFHQRCLA